MTGKVKITQEQAEAIEKYKSNGHNLEQFVVHGERGFHGYYEPLKELPIDDMARLLYEPDSYEIEPMYKVGDWVAHLDGSNIYVTGNKKIVEVHSYEQILEGFDYVRHGENGEWGTPVNLLRHATPEEIKAEQERRKWAAIGREVGEFRHGDVRITKGTVSGFVRTHCAKNAKDEYEDGELRGFYPVESFISFEDGDEA